MKTYSLTERPEGDNMPRFRKAGLIEAAKITQPFKVKTKEGILEVSPATCVDWDGGYYIAYPTDDSEPYAIAPGYFRTNYVPI